MRWFPIFSNHADTSAAKSERSQRALNVATTKVHAATDRLRATLAELIDELEGPKNAGNDQKRP